MEDFVLLQLAEDLVLGDEVVLENVEEEVLLLEDLDPDGLLLIAILLGQLLDEVLRLLVQQRSVRLQLVAVGRNEEELADLGRGLNDSFDELLRDGLVGEVKDDCNGGIIVLALLHVQRRENLSLVAELMPLEEVIELRKVHLLELISHHIPAGLHDLQNRLVNPEVSARLSLHEFLKLGIEGR